MLFLFKLHMLMEYDLLAKQKQKQVDIIWKYLTK